ncbi:hypothetical protein GCM10010124_35710 [Pilimelia terevasa]|uniref:Phosphoglycerate mutase n=1 Tax=Pilimelia terevasa TaxID=53372 RepID=A0A8J3FJT0_9ACTN|nr:histidine phosphatase family protein [Pilimelia terevasa]GGK39905.1 hypothetical protein GCM10010124_35710 [Pilimelia terevasa]
MSTLRLVAHAATAALRAARCGAGEQDLDEGGRAAVAALAAGPRDPLGRPAAVWSSPAAAARQTAAGLGHAAAAAAPALADRGWGRWAGWSPADLLTRDLDAARRWLAAPELAPPGGESVAALRRRVGGWLADRAAEDRGSAAVTHPAVVRAAFLVALGLPDGAYAQIDVAPLSVTTLRYRGGRWALHVPAAH